MGRFSQWEAIIDPAAVLLAFSVSAAAGVFFGFYPAHKASLLYRALRTISKRSVT